MFRERLKHSERGDTNRTSLICERVQLDSEIASVAKAAITVEL